MGYPYKKLLYNRDPPKPHRSSMYKPLLCTLEAVDCRFEDSKAMARRFYRSTIRTIKRPRTRFLELPLISTNCLFPEVGPTIATCFRAADAERPSICTWISVVPWGLVTIIDYRWVYGWLRRKDSEISWQVRTSVYALHGSSGICFPRGELGLRFLR